MVLDNLSTHSAGALYETFPATDQHCAGQEVSSWANRADLLLRPAAALAAWLPRRDPPQSERLVRRRTGPKNSLFCGLPRHTRSPGQNCRGKALVRLVKEVAAARAGSAGFTGHSLRVGLAAAAADWDAGRPELMR